MEFIDLSINKNNFVKYKNIKTNCLYGKTEILANVFLTICIPTFKRTHLLKNAIDSALNQNTKIPYCVLVLDNENSGMENDNLKLIKQYKNTNLLYFQNSENIGMAGNWNRCAELVLSTYFAYLHDDDLLKEEYVQTVYEIINKYSKISCLINSLEHVNYPDQNNNVIIKKGIYKYISNFFHRIRPLYIYMHNLVPNLFLDNMYGPPTCGILFKRNDFLESGGFNSDYYPVLDWYFMIYFSQKYMILKCRKHLSLYRWLENESLKPETQVKFSESRAVVKLYLSKRSWFCKLLQYLFYKDFIAKENKKDFSFLFSFMNKVYRYFYSN